MKRTQLKSLGLAVGATEPVSVDDAKAWAAIDSTLDDAVIQSIIITAREMCENFISRDIVSKNYSYFDPNPEIWADSYHYVSLPRPTNSSLVTLVQDANGALIEDTDWEFYGIDGRIIRLFQTPSEFVRVSFASDPVLSPLQQELIQAAVKTLIEQIYDNRANLEGDSDIMILDKNIKQILTPAKYVYF